MFKRVVLLISLLLPIFPASADRVDDLYNYNIVPLDARCKFIGTQLWVGVLLGAMKETPEQYLDGEGIVFARMQPGDYSDLTLRERTWFISVLAAGVAVAEREIERQTKLQNEKEEGHFKGHVTEVPLSKSFADGFRTSYEHNCNARNQGIEDLFHPVESEQETGFHKTASSSGSLPRSLAGSEDIPEPKKVQRDAYSHAEEAWYSAFWVRLSGCSNQQWLWTRNYCDESMDAGTCNKLVIQRMLECAAIRPPVFPDKFVDE